MAVRNKVRPARAAQVRPAKRATARGHRGQAGHQSDPATYSQDNAELQQWLAKEKTDQTAANSLQMTALASDQQQAKKDLATHTTLVASWRRSENPVPGHAANQADTGILAQLQALSEASSQIPPLMSRGCRLRRVLPDRNPSRHREGPAQPGAADAVRSRRAGQE